MIAMRFALALLLAMAGAEARAAGAASPWALPAEGKCQPEGGLRAAPGEDASAPVPFQTGDSFEIGRLEVLRRFVPKELWQYRDRFFYEGMRLEIGPCFRDYGAPAFYHEATEKLRGQAKLDGGGLTGYLAGQPFPPDTIDPADPQAGALWAWNVAQRYQAAGFRGKFRVTDLLGRVGRAEPFDGEIFKLDVSHRADLPGSGYAVSFAKGNDWVAGGKLFSPFAARDFAWRQYRNDENKTKAIRTDDLVAFLPEWRRVRRIPAVDIEGLYMPSFSVGVQPSQQLMVGSGAGSFGGGVAAAGAPSGVGGGTIQTKRSGFEGLEIRPVLWSYRVVGVEDLLAPINIAAPVYPAEANREFGPWGLSFASDRWDLRRVLVLEARVKGQPGFRGESRLTMYVDLQTLVPLYYISYSSKEEPIDIGVFASRWSEDRPDYPKWPDDPQRPVRVVDSVGAAFANLAEEGSWRRESWDLVSTPPPEAELKKLESSTDLTKGR